MNDIILAAVGFVLFDFYMLFRLFRNKSRKSINQSPSAPEVLSTIRTKTQDEKRELKELEASGDYRRLVSRLIELEDFGEAVWVAMIMRDYDGARTLIDRQIKNRAESSEYLGSHFELIHRVSGAKAAEKEILKFLDSAKDINVVKICLRALHECRRYQSILKICSDLPPNLAQAPEIIETVKMAQKSLDFNSDKREEGIKVLNSQSASFAEKTKAAMLSILWGERDSAEQQLESLALNIVNREDEARCLRAKSFIYQMEKEYKAEEEMLRKALELEPVPFYYFLLENCLFNQGRYAEAYEYFELQKDEEADSKPSSRKADYLSAIGEKAKALEIYKEVIEEIWQRRRKEKPDIKEIGLHWEQWRIFELSQ